jgi:hypothetical protein
VPDGDSFAENAVGIPPPVNFILDASILDDVEEHKLAAEDIKQHRIKYVFPEGLNQVELFEECRALTLLDDFDAMYDFTMRSLVGKSVVILLEYGGVWRELCCFQVVDIMQDLRGVQEINDWPILVTWLTEFIGAYLARKYPAPDAAGKEK